MKYALCSTVIALGALSLGASPAPSGPPASASSKTSASSKSDANVKGGATATKSSGGAHSGKNFTLTRMRPRQVASDLLTHPMVLVVSADSTMQGGKQVINVSASSHLDGPDGPLESVEKIGYRMTQPTATQSTPNATPVAQVQGSQTVPAAGGKYKTVVVEAFMSGNKINDTKAVVTVPGDQ